jgi:hypothetical protein
MMQSGASARGWLYYLGPPILGAVALFAIVGLRMLAKLSSLARSPAVLMHSLVVLAYATGAGCLAGVVYVVLGRPARRVQVVGPYLAGVITIAAYMGALALGSSYFSDDPLVKDRSDFFLFAGITVVFGLFAGHSWFREKKTSMNAGDPPAV